MKKQVITVGLLCSIIMNSSLVCYTSADETKTNIEPITVKSYEDIDQIYQFDLEGVHYSLPCSPESFTENGWTGNDLQDTVPAQHTMGQIRLYPEDSDKKYIELTVLNDTDDELTVENCEKVVGIRVYEDSDVAFVMNSGISFSGEFDDEAFLESLMDVYGRDERICRMSEDALSYSFYKNAVNENDNQPVVGWAYNTDNMRIDSNSVKLEYIK